MPSPNLTASSATPERESIAEPKKSTMTFAYVRDAFTIAGDAAEELSQLCEFAPRRRVLKTISENAKRMAELLERPGVCLR